MQVKMWSVDIYVEVGGRKIAVEVDGPQHYTEGERKLLGSYAVRDTCMQELGFIAVRVPCYRWESMGTASVSERTAALQRLVHSKHGSVL